MDTRLPVFFVISTAFLYSGECMVCTDKPDGVYEMNCRAFTKCVEEQPVIVNCDHDEAFNRETVQCENKWDVPPPCGTYRDCADKHDGFYPDLETQCHSYYICSNGVFVGHSLCPPGLVFNKYQGVCDYAYNAPPPCGSNLTHVVAMETKITPPS